jgi:hypothetical protein
MGDMTSTDIAYNEMKKRQEFDENSNEKAVEDKEEKRISKEIAYNYDAYSKINIDSANDNWKQFHRDKYMAIRSKLKNDKGYEDICEQKKDFINSRDTLEEEIGNIENVLNAPASSRMGKFAESLSFSKKEKKKKEYEEAQTDIQEKKKELEKLNYIISSINNETLSDVYKMDESELEEKKPKIYIIDSGGKRTRRRRKSKKARKSRKSRKSKKARKSRR